jgi:hypothetical protein
MGHLKTLSALAAIFYVASVPLSTTLGMLELRSSTEATKTRNHDVLEKLAVLNPDQASLTITWETRQKAITHEIAANGGAGIDVVPFVPFIAYAVDALQAADRAKIALVPRAKGDPEQKTTLIVDESHGCLYVSLDRSNKDNADDARGLLYAFSTRKSPGKYVFKVSGDLKSREFTPLLPGETASGFCPAPSS